MMVSAMGLPSWERSWKGGGVRKGRKGWKDEEDYLYIVTFVVETAFAE